MTVKLETPFGAELELEFEHAERVLKMRQNGGWVLSKNQGLTFENDELKRKNKSGSTPESETA